MIGSLVQDGIGSTLVAAPATSPADAYRAFMEAHLDEAYRLATHILGAPADAEDAVHDAAISAWRHWPDRRDADRTEAWLRRIVVNACRDRIRAKARVRVLPGDLEADASRHPLVADASQLVHERDALQRLLARLDVDERVLLTLRFGLDLTVPTIAAVLGTREGTVKSRLHRALARARIELERQA